jgi:CRISPR-associated endoribonuclease Cas6
MLATIEVVLEFPNHEKIYPAMGSIMHGALMDSLSQETATYFHTMSLRPYSQCIRWDKESQQPIWRIGTLTDYAFTQIMEALQSVSHIYLKQKGYAIQVQRITVKKQLSYEELARSFLQAESPPSGADYEFLTVTGFKQAGRYVIWPNNQLMYQNLLNRWNTFSPHVKLEAEALAVQLDAHCRLMRYQLHSQAFPIEGRLVYGFSGSQRLTFYGYDMLKRLQGLLAIFAEFSGIGIKTALGMGAVHTHVIYKESL